MSGVRTTVIIKNNQLLLFAALNDLRRSRVEFSFNLIDYWQHEWRKQTENEYIELIYTWSVERLPLLIMKDPHLVAALSDLEELESSRWSQ